MMYASGTWLALGKLYLIGHDLALLYRIGHDLALLYRIGHALALLNLSDVILPY